MVTLELLPRRQDKLKTQKMLNCGFKKILLKIAPPESTAEELSFEWSHVRISAKCRKVKLKVCGVLVLWKVSFRRNVIS